MSDRVKETVFPCHVPNVSATMATRLNATPQELFFVLCPTVETPDRSELLGPSTWESRGWCRMERQLRDWDASATVRNSEKL